MFACFVPLNMVKLNELISDKCGQYSGWFINLITDNGEDICYVPFFINEVCFHLSGYVSIQNR